MRTTRLALAFLLASLLTTFAPTIAPTSFDFGDTVLNSPQSPGQFLVTVSAGVPDSVRVSLTGPDTGDFKSNATTAHPITPWVGGGTGPTCRNHWTGSNAPLALPPNQCELFVEFSPRTVGPKTATLVVTEPNGNRVTAALRGNGVAGCTYAVVPCNYAAHYSGTVSWTHTINGGAGSYNEVVNVTIVNGVAACNGSAREGGVGTSRSAAITGQGLFAVEFDYYDGTQVPIAQARQPGIARRGSTTQWLPLSYKVTVACPSPDWLATPSGDPATPSTPAELDGREKSSDPQRATGVMQGQLKGSATSTPDNDPVNNVTGSVVVNWDLKRQ